MVVPDRVHGSLRALLLEIKECRELIDKEKAEGKKDKDLRR